MKVATRITVATAVVVAIASATYALFDLRSRVEERKAATGREARALTSTLRVSLEAVAADDIRNARYRAEQLLHELEAIVSEAYYNKMRELLVGRTTASRLLDEDKQVLPRGERITLEVLAEIPQRLWTEIQLEPGDGRIEEEIQQLAGKRDEAVLAIEAQYADAVGEARVAAPSAPALQESPTRRQQRAELEQRLALARAQGGLARPIDLATSYRPPPEGQLRELSRASGNWRVTVTPRVRAIAPAGLDLTESQLRRLTTLIEVPQLSFSDVEDGQYFYAVAVRAASALGEPVVIGMLEIAKPADALASTWDDYIRAVILVVLIVLVTTVMVGALASRFVSRPITKLLRGIDDVAKGDLSHAILSEHDDEIGAIATRFNDMTYSLRESRAETQRQNEAKLALEQRLGQTEKLATIGQLAAEIAHEVGTPLNVIAGRARSIQKKAKDPEVVEKNAEIVAEQTARITRIIQRLLDFTRRKVGHTERAEVDLDELATTTLELLSAQFSVAKVRTKLDRSDQLPRVAGDRDRLQQVLINLMLNAVQAMPDGGALSVETRVVQRTRPGLEHNAEQSFVRCSVADTGIGIPAEIRDKIFDPFYTTKEGQGGTGLGLAVCSGIVKEHDGWLEVDDAAGGGSVFRVYLPT